jgi:1-acyl-sn-glycerol-3-phosphate acyltransferase
MSTIALGMGSVLLGIIVDYALYIFSLFKAKGSIEQVIKDMGISILMCSLTTTIAFFSLLFVKSEVLRDLGLFAGLSVFGAALFSLIILPHLMKLENKPSEKKVSTFIDKIAAYPFESNRFLIALIFAVTLAMLFFYKKAAFETDMNAMNFLSKKMKEAEKNLNSINDISLNTIYVFSTGENLGQALSADDKVSGKLKELKSLDIVKKYSNVGSILISDSIQKLRIKKWIDYWTFEKKKKLENTLINASEKYGFKKDAFNSFYIFLVKNFQPIDIGKFDSVRKLFLNDMITENQGISMVMSIVKVNRENRHKVYTALSCEKGAIVFDYQEITSNLVKGIKMDFDLLVNLCLIFVTLTLILTFGRFETGLIASIPMFISWLWTLGFMGIFGLKFNIINIIVSTFVFGLGVDYSILIMRGMLLEYKTGQKELASYKTSIFLSSFTTLVGVGALLLAKHPSLNSIALISILGLLSVVLITCTFEPILFKWLVSKKGRNRDIPITLTDLLFNVISIFFFLAEFIFLISIRILVIPLPIRKAKKKMMLHIAFSMSLRVLEYIPFHIKKKIINESHEDFKKPSMIICNHKSHLDVPFIIKMSPNIIVLTAKWVWNNPVFAPTIRFLDYYPLNDGYEAISDKLQKKVNEGYSVMVFPEGTRSPDSSIGRFHKGAFLLAEKLNLDIVPIIIHGTKDCMNKGENHFKGGSVTVKVFPRVKAQDKSFGNDYHEKAKSFQRFFREEYRRMQYELEIPSYFRRKLIRNYIYKGPVLEWYTRVKLSLENNYEWFHNRIPRDATIVDIGCGYGMMAYMLNFTSDQRKILGIDYDNDKIELANNCLSKNDRILFVTADAVTYDYTPADVFLLSDVLHYLTEKEQEQLLTRCIERLNTGGQIIIRDADKDLQKRHKGTQFTEFFSTRFGFNKAVNKRLYFFSGKKIFDIAGRYGMKLEIIDNSKLTSNLLYVMKHKAITEII